jgi:hypothetical protein
VASARRPARRVVEIAAWFLSSITLILLPKCPMCIAAYVALFSTVSISIAAAAQLRAGLLVLSVAVLVMLALRRLRHVRDWRVWRATP